MNRLFSVRTVVAVGIGAALMFVLMRFAAIPTGIPHTYLNPGMAVLAVFAAVFGPVAGLLIGFIGHTLADLTWGAVWWSWVAGSAFLGFTVGFLRKFFRFEEGGFGIKQAILFNVTQIAANFLAWPVIAASLDMLIYGEPASKVYAQGITAAIVNSISVLILATALLFAYSKTRTKAGSLRADG